MTYLHAVIKGSRRAISHYQDYLNISLAHWYQSQKSSTTTAVRNAWGRFYWRFLVRNTTSMENSFHCNPVPNFYIVAKFRTYHDSTAVVSFTQFCDESWNDIWMIVKRNFNRIRTAREKASPKLPTGSFIRMDQSKGRVIQAGWWWRYYLWSRTLAMYGFNVSL